MTGAGIPYGDPEAPGTRSYQDAVYFYDPNLPYGWLSNFSNHPMAIDGVVWPTVEHFFQASKFEQEEIRQSIRLAASPAQAKRIAKSQKQYRRKDWSDIKEHVMLTALRLKFRQHSQLALLLLETDGRLLVEDTEHDPYWGRGHENIGLNRLGQLIMQVRGELHGGCCYESR